MEFHQNKSVAMIICHCLASVIGGSEDSLLYGIPDREIKTHQVKCLPDQFITNPGCLG